MPRWGFAALAALGCLLLGISWAFSLSRRLAALRAWARVLAKVEAGLGYRTSSIGEMLTRAADGETDGRVRARLMDCAARMREDPMLPLAAAMEGVAAPELTRADSAALSPLWQGLGVGDEEAQRGLLRAVRKAVEVQIAEAAEAERKDRRLALSLGVIGGGAVFLFLL